MLLTVGYNCEVLIPIGCLASFPGHLFYLAAIEKNWEQDKKGVAWEQGYRVLIFLGYYMYMVRCSGVK